MLDDAVRLRHMRECAVQAVDVIDGRAREDLLDDMIFALGLVKLLEIIGEASSKMSDAFKASHPQFEWQAMNGMRNRLVHAYFDVDVDVVWDTVTTKLPPLIAQIDAIQL